MIGGVVDKSASEEFDSECVEHVGEAGLGLAAVPWRELTGPLDVGFPAAGSQVPNDDDCVDRPSKRERTKDGLFAS